MWSILIDCIYISDSEIVYFTSAKLTTFFLMIYRSLAKPMR